MKEMWDWSLLWVAAAAGELSRCHLMPRKMPCGSLKSLVNASPYWYLSSFYGRDPVNISRAVTSVNMDLWINCIS